jgi:hypothetical protein
MADAVNLAQIRETAILPYEACRHNLQTGDIVFCSGTYFFSHFIRWFTKSTWSHVGMIYRDDNLKRVFILESETLVGVRLAPLSKYIRDYHGKNKPYKGHMFVARVLPELDPEDLKKAISFGMDELTKPYDNLEILRIAIRILFRLGRRNRDRKYICSELVYECFRKADMWFKFHKRSISPDDIWRDTRVAAVCRIM